MHRRLIGRYEVGEAVGAGAFATVYRAYDPTLDSDVAIKVLAENWAHDPVVREQFIEEARLFRQLASHRLITVHDILESDGGQPAIVMRLAERGTLADRLGGTGDGEVRPTGPADLAFIVEELGSCLRALEDGGLVHRDIKPSNLLIIRRAQTRRMSTPATEHFAADDAMVLGDLGLARPPRADVTSASLRGGTPAYMAPEQLGVYGPVDHRADLYAATAVVLEAAVGRRSVDRPAATWSRWAPTLPEPLANELGWGLQDDPGRRPPHAAAWRDRLLAALRLAYPPTGAATRAAAPTRQVRRDELHVRPPAPAAPPALPPSGPGAPPPSTAWRST